MNDYDDELEEKEAAESEHWAAREDLKSELRNGIAEIRDELNARFSVTGDAGIECAPGEFYNRVMDLLK